MNELKENQKFGNDSDIEANANSAIETMPTINSAGETNQAELEKQKPTPFYLFTSNVFQNQKNTYYNNDKKINNVDDLREAVSKDHIFGKMRKNYRSEKDWVCGDVLYADIDNSETDNESDWITPEKFINEFKEYEFYLIASRNHNKEKDGKKARPKFHIYFPLGKAIADKNVLKNYLIKLNTYKTYFDKSIKDVSRYFFGVDTQADNHFIQYHNGKSILVLLDTIETKKENNKKTNIESSVELDVNNKIKDGNRHRTLLDLSSSFFSKNGITDNEENDIVKARAYLLEVNEKYFENPLLDDRIGGNEAGGELYDIIKFKRDKYVEWKKENTFIFDTENEAFDFVEKEGLILFLENKSFFVMNTKCNDTENIYNLSTFFHRYREYKIKKGVKQVDNGKVKDVYLNFTQWFLDKKTDDAYNVIYSVVYDPSLSIGKNKEKKIFNLYKGFSYRPFNHNLDITPVYDFAREILNNDDSESYEYLLNWIASLFQYPARKTTAIGLKGTHGIGKNIFINFLGGILGEDNYFYADNAQILESQFNKIYQNKLLCFFDEGVWSNDRKSIGYIKAMITNNESVSNEKNVKMKQEKTFYKIIMATNEDWVIKVEHGNRRFFIPTLNNKWGYDNTEGDKGKQKERDNYFTVLSKYFYFKNKRGNKYTKDDLEFLDKVREQFLYDMINRDISNWNWENIPITTELLYQQDLSEEPITKTIKSFIRGEIDIPFYKKESQLDKIYVLLDDIYKIIKDETGIKNLSKTKIGHIMAEILPDVSKSKYDYYGTMKNCYVFDKDLNKYISYFPFPSMFKTTENKKEEGGGPPPPPTPVYLELKTKQETGNRKSGAEKKADDNKEPEKVLKFASANPTKSDNPFNNGTSNDDNGVDTFDYMLKQAGM